MLAMNILFDLIGRFHPMMVHFPIGILIGALILELFTLFQRKEKDYTAMVYLGAGSAMIAAIMGQLLSTSSGEYTGILIQQHQWLGWITAILAVTTALIYRSRSDLPPLLPMASLGMTCIAVTIAGHLGASITHGTDYISKAFDNSGTQKKEALSINQWSDIETFSHSQLDRLNLEVRAIFAHNCLCRWR